MRQNTKYHAAAAVAAAAIDANCMEASSFMMRSVVVLVVAARSQGRTKGLVGERINPVEMQRDARLLHDSWGNAGFPTAALESSLMISDYGLRSRHWAVPFGRRPRPSVSMPSPGKSPGKKHSPKKKKKAATERTAKKSKKGEADGPSESEEEDKPKRARKAGEQPPTSAAAFATAEARPQRRKQP